jgi:hypothetical protein
MTDKVRSIDGREVVFDSDDLGECAIFKDTIGTSFKPAGRGDTKDAMVEDLKNNCVRE